MDRHPMRRSKQEISDPLEIEQLLKKASVCHLGLSDSGQPYVVPMNYGYADNTFYLHCASEGRKLDILRRNSQVCVEVVIDSALISAKEACGWTTHFTSVIGFGRAVILEDPKEKEDAINKLMQAYTGMPVHEFSEKTLLRTCLLRIDMEEIRAKKSD